MTNPQPADQPDFDSAMMQRAARLALRGIGCVAPNPPVGCVIVDPTTRQIIAEGWHTHFGGPHAERHALERCRQSGQSTEGCTAYITFEPCNHQGKTPPCTQALINAKIRRVVIARRDPNPQAAGGLTVLREAGIIVDEIDCPAAHQLTNPFVKVPTTGLPYVIAKWAQTIDGKIATQAGQSKWISNENSRAAVHRMRARVDAILTGIGTVLADDPNLTARTVRRVYAHARRIVIDPHLRINEDANLVQTANVYPTTIICHAHRTDVGHQKKIRRISASGVDIVHPANEGESGRFNLETILRQLQTQYNLTTILVEAGPALLGSLFAAGNLVDEIIVYLAPKLAGDPHALSAVNTGTILESMGDAAAFKLKRTRRCAPGDVELIYSRETTD